MFSLYFGLGMLIWFVIHLITRLFHCKKCNKNKASSRQELFERGDWTYIYNNPSIMEYSLSEAENLMDIIYRDIIAIRGRALSILNYLFLTLGGLFYLFFYKNNTLNALCNANTDKIILVLCGYITFSIFYIALNHIVPSRNKTISKNLEPLEAIPKKNNAKDLCEIKIEKLLALQEGIEKNGKYMDTLRQKLFFLVFEISVIILILIIYSWFFFFP